MLDVLEFVFRNFWTWLGTVILVGVIVEGFAGFVRVNIQRIVDAKRKDSDD